MINITIGYKNLLFNRDVKLDNVLYKVTPSGFIVFKLGDLGLARRIPVGSFEICWADSRYLDYQTDNDGDLTIAGTPRFMAPEVTSQRAIVKIKLSICRNENSPRKLYCSRRKLPRVHQTIFGRGVGQAKYSLT